MAALCIVLDPAVIGIIPGHCLLPRDSWQLWGSADQHPAGRTKAAQRAPASTATSPLRVRVTWEGELPVLGGRVYRRSTSPAPGQSHCEIRAITARRGVYIVGHCAGICHRDGYCSLYLGICFHSSWEAGQGLDGCSRNPR